MAKESIQIDGQKNMNAKMAHEGQRDGWTEETYIRKNLDTNNNYDWSRRNLNFAVQDGKIIPLDEEERLQDAYNRRLNEIGTRQYKEGADNAPYTLATIILGGDRDVMREMAFGNQYIDYNVRHHTDNSQVMRRQAIENWAKDCYAWLCERVGSKNVLGFEVHLDESNPHIHAWIMPTAMKKAKGRCSKNKQRKMKEQLSFKTFFGEVDGHARAGELKRSDAFRQWHDDYYNVIGSRYGLERGDDMRSLSAVERADRLHKSKADYIKFQELKQEIQHLRQVQIITKSKVEELEKKKQDLQKSYTQIDDKTKKARQELNRVVGSTNALLKQERPLQAKIQRLSKDAALTDIERKAANVLGAVWEMIVAAVKAIVNWQYSMNRPKEEQTAIAQAMGTMVRNGIAKDIHDAGEVLWEIAKAEHTSKLYGGAWDDSAHRDVIAIADGMTAIMGRKR